MRNNVIILSGFNTWPCGCMHNVFIYIERERETYREQVIDTYVMNHMLNMMYPMS